MWANLPETVDLIIFTEDILNPLSTNFTKWSNTLEQFVAKLMTNCLNVFDRFVGLALKGLTFKKSTASSGWDWQLGKSSDSKINYLQQFELLFATANIILVLGKIPVGIYLSKVNNGKTTTMCEICLKLTIKTPNEVPCWISKLNWGFKTLNWDFKKIYVGVKGFFSPCLNIPSLFQSY